MKIGIIVLSGTAGSKSTFTAIEKKFKDINPLLSLTHIENLEDYSREIQRTGSPYEQVLIVNALGNKITDTDTIAECVQVIAYQVKTTVVDKEEALASTLVSVLVDCQQLKYQNLEKLTAKGVYSSVFGSTVSKVNSDISREMQTTIVKPEPIAVAPVAVAPVDVIPEEVPTAEIAIEKPKGFFQKLPGGFKNRLRNKIVTPNNEEVKPAVEPTNPEPAITEPKEVEAPTSTVEKNKTEIFNNVPEVEEPPVFINEDAFSTDDAVSWTPKAEPAPIAEPEPEVVMPQVEVSPKITPPPVAAPLRPVSKRGKKKASSPKANAKLNKSQELSMVKRPKVVFVTGSGRIGVSTLVASLGYTAAQMYCKSLIVDLDCIKRTQSAIMRSYDNTHSTSLSSLISAVRSPYLIEEIAVEHYTNVSQLGIDISIPESRKLAENLNEEGIKTMLSMAQTKYTFVICDIPWNYLLANPGLISIANDILYVTSNDLITIMDDINTIDVNAFSNSTEYFLFMNKLHLIINMSDPSNTFDNKSINQNNLTKIMRQLTDEADFDHVPVIGNIPLMAHIGNQASLEQPASAYSPEFAEHCRNILQNISN